MVMPAAAYELEYEDELEWEGEWEDEGEWESEEFLSALGNFARGQAAALQRQGSWQRQLALRAARSALRQGLPALGRAAGGMIGGRGARQAGSRMGQAAASRLGRMLPQREYEFEMEWEDEGEWEDFANPLRRVYPDALMEHLGRAAAEAESEEEAEAFIGALVPLAARVIPAAAPAVMRAAPGLIRGLGGVARTLRAGQATRPMVRTLPTVMRRTAAELARRQAAGRPATPAVAVRSLARQTARVVGSPRVAGAAMRRSRAADRSYHRQLGPGSCPHRLPRPPRPVPVGPAARPRPMRIAAGC